MSSHGRFLKPASLCLLAASLAPAGIVDDVRAAIAQNNLNGGASLIRSYRASRGVTPEMLEALSWMARGAFDRKDYAQAATYARETYQLASEQLKSRPLDRDASLPTAVGASIEVQGNVLAAQGQLSEAIAYLDRELKKYHSTSIRIRIQKNINLLSLEGKPAPPLEKLAIPKGKPAVLFFWAHWCPDCKQQGPILARLKSEFGPKGLVIVAPTQKYGYVEGGEDAPPAAEERYIEQIRQRFYANVVPGPASISEENFRRYGASSTPTLALVDRAGIVRLYHPGAMSYEELRPRIEALVR
jgi:thiol-disulfide isomerase/thioredoxin